MKKLLLGVVGAAVLGGAWYWGSPYYTLHQMRAAAQAKDVDALSAHVDYPALREDLKSDIKAQMSAKMTEDAGNPFGAIGMALAVAIIDPMIDGLVSPEGLQRMFDEQQNGATQNKKGPTLPTMANSDDVVIERDGLDRFRARSKAKPDGALVFRREGMGWTLVGMDLPEEGKGD